MAETALKQDKEIRPKPILKWAGGKTQMLGEILPKVPGSYGKYIEPFVGGGFKCKGCDKLSAPV